MDRDVGDGILDRLANPQRDFSIGNGPGIYEFEFLGAYHFPMGSPPIVSDRFTPSLHPPQCRRLSPLSEMDQVLQTQEREGKDRRKRGKRAIGAGAKSLKSQVPIQEFQNLNPQLTLLNQRSLDIPEKDDIFDRPFYGIKLFR